MKSFLLILILFSIYSCGDIEFVYNKNGNQINPLYEKTTVETYGINLTYMGSYMPILFGKDKTKEYNLVIQIQEKKTKKSVETNQVTSNLRYELVFGYTLISNDKECIVYKKNIMSNFMITPKSEGYNFGTDTSLEKKYELIIEENLSQFISYISAVNIDICQ